MRLILRLFFFFALFWTNLSADELLQDLEQDTKIYFKYEKKENTTIYKNQIFKVKLSLLVLNDNNFSVKGRFSNYWGVKFLDYNISWGIKEDNTWEAFLYLKAISKNIKLPDINITIIDNHSIQKIGEAFASGYKIQAKNLNWLRNSSDLLAKSVEVVDWSSRTYNKNSNIVLLTLKANSSNLEDININNKDIISQGIKDLELSYPYSKGVYYAIIPNHIRIFTFNYFNIEFKKFQDIEISININDDSSFLIADIDPESKLYEKYKLLFFIVIIFLALFLSFYRKKISYLIFAGLFTFALIWQFFINEKGIIKQGSKFRVLPISNSTIFYVSGQRENVKILKKSEGFVKVNFNNKIGWVNEEYIEYNTKN